jgi:plastocyanin
MARPRLFVLASVATGVVAIAALAPAAFSTNSAKYTVTATDFKFKFSPARVTAGRNTFTLVNRGEATHDLKIANKKTRILDPGQRQTINVTLKKGRYPYLCTVPGHAALGMKGTVVVR